MSGRPMDFTITPPKLKPSRGVSLLLLSLKPMACIMIPLMVPTIVYGVDGCTTTFWWTLGLSLFTSLLLLTFDIQKVKDLIQYLKINRSGGIRCLIKVSLMLLVCGVGAYAYHIHISEVFNACIFVTGVITGTFSTDITAYWNFRRKKNLPYVNFTKNSPKPVRPTFLDLRRKSINNAACTANLLPLKRQLSSPAKKSSSLLNSSTFNGIRHPEVMSPRTISDSISPVLHGYPSSSSSSGESDGPEVQQQQPALHTPTKRRLIAAELITLSPIVKTPEKSPISKKRLDFQENANRPSVRQHLDISFPEIPIFTYNECNVENLISQSFDFFQI